MSDALEIGLEEEDGGSPATPLHSARGQPSMQTQYQQPHTPSYQPHTPNYSVASAVPSHPEQPQMRHRSVQQSPAEEDSSAGVRRLVRSLKTLDVYPKTEDDIAIKSASGGAISLISFAIILLLVLSETWSFLSVSTVHSIRVDTRPSAQLQIHFDITFHALRCSETTIDVMDVSGEVQVATQANIHRIRLDSKGNRIGRGEYEDHAHDNEAIRPQMNPMLAALGIGFPPQGMGGPDTHTDQRGEGCNVVGVLQVNKVAGNVHVALGGQHSHPEAHPEGDQQQPSGSGLPSNTHDHPSHPSQPTHRAQQPQHIHQFMIHEMLAYNCSHRINHLSFGEPLPGALNPLDGVEQIIPRGAGTAHMQYFLKIVPTTFTSSFGYVVESNQFSATQQTQGINMADAFRQGQGGGDGRIPGVFFVYDLSPFMVSIVERRMPFSTWITSLFAIVGGVVTVAGVIDSLLYASAKVLRVTSPIAKKM